MNTMTSSNPLMAALIQGRTHEHELRLLSQMGSMFQDNEVDATVAYHSQRADEAIAAGHHVNALYINRAKADYDEAREAYLRLWETKPHDPKVLAEFKKDMDEARDAYKEAKSNMHTTTQSVHENYHEMSTAHQEAMKNVTPSANARGLIAY